MYCYLLFCPAAQVMLSGFPSWSSRSGSWYGSTTFFPLLPSAGRKRGSCTCTSPVHEHPMNVQHRFKILREYFHKDPLRFEPRTRRSSSEHMLACAEVSTAYSTGLVTPPFRLHTSTEDLTISVPQRYQLQHTIYTYINYDGRAKRPATCSVDLQHAKLPVRTVYLTLKHEKYYLPLLEKDKTIISQHRTIIE